MKAAARADGPTFYSGKLCLENIIGVQTLNRFAIQNRGDVVRMLSARGWSIQDATGPDDVGTTVEW